MALHREQGPLAAPVAFPSVSVGVISQHAIPATGALILTKHLLHPKAIQKVRGAERGPLVGDGPAGSREEGWRLGGRKTTPNATAG